ncbi:MAG: helix-turn-helix transcriptional regulator [Pseudomonadota bacterium]
MLTNDNLEKSIFGRRLRQVRTLAGIPQYQLGILAGLEESSSSARISRYESGMYMPQPNFVARIAEVLNVPAPYFYCVDDRLAELVLLFHQLPDRKQKLLLQRATELSS